MQTEESRRYGSIAAVSWGAGVLAGTATGFGTRVAGFGVKGVTAVTRVLIRPVAFLVAATDGRFLRHSRKPSVQKQTGSPILKQEATRRQFGPSKTSADKAPARQVSSRQAEPSRPFAPPGAQSGMPKTAAVTAEEVAKATFSEATDRIIFLRALTDLASGDPAARADAAGALAGIRHKLSVKALAQQATSGCEPCPQVRRECVKALASLAMTGSIPAIQHSLTDLDPSVRLAGVWGLYRLRASQSASALVGMLSDESEEVRRRAATCLGWLGREEFAVDLIPLLTDDSISVRRAVIDAACKLGSHKTVAALIERLNDPVESIRKAALVAVETITGKRISEKPQGGERSRQRLALRWRRWWADQYPR